MVNPPVGGHAMPPSDRHLIGHRHYAFLRGVFHTEVPVAVEPHQRHFPRKVLPGHFGPEDAHASNDVAILDVHALYRFRITMVDVLAEFQFREVPTILLEGPVQRFHCLHTLRGQEIDAPLVHIGGVEDGGHPMFDLPALLHPAQHQRCVRACDPEGHPYPVLGYLERCPV